MLPDIRIAEVNAERLSEYACVPIAFEVHARFRAHPAGLGPEGVTLVEEAVVPFLKDYDACWGEGPLAWGRKWDLANWGFLLAFAATEPVGGAAVAWNTPGVDLLEGREDLAVLWDLRVHPDFRSQGIGHRLFRSVVEWAVQRQCRELLVETQDVNVPACRFYARQGCRLGAINPGAYAEFPNEAQLLWRLDLSHR